MTSFILQTRVWDVGPGIITLVSLLVPCLNTALTIWVLMKQKATHDVVNGQNQKRFDLSDELIRSMIERLESRSAKERI